MNQLRVAPIVEGHGEVKAVRLLLQRVWTEMLGGEYLEVLQPIRQPRSQMTGSMDLTLARNGCPSFDKLCRELQARRDAP